MNNVKATLAYHGGPFLGWQKTKMGPSIEESLEQALKQLLKQEVTFQAASRTDRGVHAEGQVVNFFLRDEQDLKKLLRGIQALLPKDISLLSLELTSPSFHPTLDCKAKEYHYHICNSPFQLPFHRSFSWHFRYPLDLKKMEKATPFLIGEHDFSAFTNERVTSKEAIRTLQRITLCPLPDQRLKIEIEGLSFLYKMVRNIVGTLAYIGCGKIPLEELPTILTSRDRRLAGMTAPAHGLILKRVLY